MTIPEGQGLPDGVGVAVVEGQLGEARGGGVQLDGAAAERRLSPRVRAVGDNLENLGLAAAGLHPIWEDISNALSLTHHISYD